MRTSAIHSKHVQIPASATLVVFSHEDPTRKEIRVTKSDFELTNLKSLGIKWKYEDCKFYTKLGESEDNLQFIIENTKRGVEEIFPVGCTHPAIAGNILFGGRLRRRIFAAQRELS